MNWSDKQGPIEKGIPVPPLGRPKKYPWADLEVGDSFLIPCPSCERIRVFNTITSCRKRAQESLGRTFTTRSMKNGVRVWRIK